MEERAITVNGIRVPVHEFNTIIIGSGAAALKCADRLSEYGIESLAIVTEKLGAGTSNNSGSDKQTYYKLGTGSPLPDSAYEMAGDLFAGGSMHGDIALVEALLSKEAFYGLVSIGVPFPKNRYGGHVGYKTDHDPRQRATSAGPYTSIQMWRSLLREVERRGLKIFDGFEVISLIVSGGRAMGALALDRGKFDAAVGTGDGAADAASAFTLFMAENTVFAVGGPGGIYERSVYPESHTGAIGLALEKGAAAANLTESQYGLASLQFRWNVSGTYQQVIPRYFSTDAEGNDKQEFLNGFFPDMGKLASAVFLKGYQWPFDPRKIANSGSSLVDILVYRETALRGRRVYMDFMTNPCGDARIGGFAFEQLEREAFEYLQRSGALFGTPIERLQKMNPMAVELYRKHGIDLLAEPLEIAVCAQHNNGGLAADIWWESVNIGHLFPIGEVNGTHGVYRPGGSALNSGQVGALRAAEKIASVYTGGTLGRDAFEKAAEETVAEFAELVHTLVSPDGDDGAAEAARNELRRRMTRSGAHIRNLEDVKAAEEKACRQAESFRSLRVRSAALLSRLLVTRHLEVAHAAYLSSIRFYLERGGGSRGSYLVTGSAGEPVHEKLEDGWRSVPENPAFREQVLMTRRLEAGPGVVRFEHELVGRRDIPAEEFWFENVWNEYLKKAIYW